MLEQITNIFALFMSNFTENVLTGVTMVSAIIVFIGLMKPLLFDKIQFKPLRKAAIALSCVASCFIATAVTFWAYGIAFSYYLHASAAVFVFTVIVYWFYENTCLRNLLKKIGTIVLSKIYKTASNILSKNDVEAVKAEVKAVKAEIKQELKLGKSKVKTDKELKNL